MGYFQNCRERWDYIMAEPTVSREEAKMCEEMAFNAFRDMFTERFLYATPFAIWVLTWVYSNVWCNLSAYFYFWRWVLFAVHPFQEYEYADEYCGR